MSKILVVGPSWVGDMVMAQSLFMAIRANDPDAGISVLAPGWSAPVLARMPEVASSIDMPVGHGSLQIGTRRRVAKIIRNMGFDQAIVIPGSLKSALIPWFARIPKRTGYIGEHRYGLLNDIRKLDKEALPLNVQHYVALARPRGDDGSVTYSNPRLQVDPDARNRALEKLSLNAHRPILGICPGAEYGPAKRWPAEHFAAVANAMIDSGHQAWIFGSGKDADVAAQVNRATGHRCADLTGQTEIGEAVDLMSLAASVVTNDSGLMHIAAALQRPTLGIFGATSSTFTPPRGGQAAIVSSSIECSPCFARECPLGHHRCMRELGSSSVIEVADTLVKGGAS